MNNIQGTPISSRREARPTLRTVAEACGLAVTTVSRALNDAGDIALSTRARVKSVAAELGYVPNRAGQRLRTGRTHILGLVLAPHSEISGYTAAIVAGFGDICRSNGFELSASPDAPEDDELSVVRSIVENHRADGIVLSRTKPNDLRVRYLLEHNFPFVTHGLTELASPHASVDFDNLSFAELAVNRLVKKGHKRLLLVGAPMGLTYQTHLLTGFARGLARNGLAAPDATTQFHLETPLDELRHSIRALYRCNRQAPDGIVCAGELATLSVTAGIRDADLIPGNDVDIVAKQTSSVLDHTDPPIDSYFEDIFMTGKLLGNTLLQVIQGPEPDKPLQHIIAPQERFRT